MARRGYSNVATPLTLSGSLNSTDTTSTFNTTTTPSGWPTVPYYAVLDAGTNSEELVYVTAQSGTAFTVTRGGSLTTAYGSVTRTHSSGGSLRHVSSAADFDEANAHVNSSTGVHGLAGSVVGTTDTQTLSNKTLTTPTISDLTNVQHTHSGPSSGGSILTGTRYAVVDAIFGAGGWNGATSTSGTASASLSTSSTGVTSLTTPLAVNNIVSVGIGALPQSVQLRGTYLTIQLRVTPIYSAPSVSGGRFSFAFCSALGVNDPIGATDSFFLQIDPYTGVITLGGRANSVTQTATLSSPPTIAAGTAYDLRLDWPLAGGTGNAYVNGTLIGTVPSLRAWSTVGTANCYVHLLATSGASSAVFQSRMLQLAVGDF